jgi:hypothetical protein
MHYRCPIFTINSASGDRSESYGYSLGLGDGFHSTSLLPQAGGGESGGSGGASASRAGGSNAAGSMSGSGMVNGTGGSPGPNTSNALRHGTTGSNLGTPDIKASNNALSAASGFSNDSTINNAVKDLGSTNTGILAEPHR